MLSTIFRSWIKVWSPPPICPLLLKVKVEALNEFSKEKTPRWKSSVVTIMAFTAGFAGAQEGPWNSSRIRDESEYLD